jgi:DNA-binding transcriptional LysR family regulator
MTRALLPALVVFRTVAQQRSFRGAARMLGVTVSAVSHAINGLEASLGFQVLARTTRSVTLTEAGQRLLAQLEPALQAIDEAIETARALQNRISGAIRLSVPRSAAEYVMVPLVARFLAAFPAASVELIVEDAIIDIVAERFDAGVRFGESLEQDMIAMPIGTPQRAMIVASPAYLHGRAVPQVPADLHHHLCIQRRFAGGGLYRWDFERDGKALQFAGQGSLTLNDDALILQAALAGVGVAFTFEAAAAPYLARGELVALLQDWYPGHEYFYLYYPAHKRMRPVLRAFIDFARGRAPT